MELISTGAIWPARVALPSNFGSVSSRRRRFDVTGAD